MTQSGQDTTRTGRNPNRMQPGKTQPRQGRNLDKIHPRHDHYPHMDTTQTETTWTKTQPNFKPTHYQNLCQIEVIYIQN